MKPTVFPSLGRVPWHAPASAHISNGGAAVQRLFASLKAYAVDRRMRAELAELDVAVLKDIGIAEDEISRVRAYEVFTPRAWRK